LKSVFAECETIEESEETNNLAKQLDLEITDFKS
jgi:hypothetical protein